MFKPFETMHVNAYLQVHGGEACPLSGLSGAAGAVCSGLSVSGE